MANEHAPIEIKKRVVLESPKIIDLDTAVEKLTGIQGADFWAAYVADKHGQVITTLYNMRACDDGSANEYEKKHRMFDARTALAHLNNRTSLVCVCGANDFIDVYFTRCGSKYVIVYAWYP